MPGADREPRVTPFLLVLSSPSGAGKSTIAQHLLSAREDLGYSVSATTRKARPGEIDGEAYHFLTRKAFQAKVHAGEFVEWAEYGGELYGTLRAEVEQTLASGRHVVMDIEVQGARQVRKGFENSVQVFIMPPNAGELIKRLRGRGTENMPAMVRRLGHAAAEVGEVLEYDYVVVNTDLVQAVDQVAAILDAESHRVRRRLGLADFVEALRAEITGRMQSLEAGAPAGEDT